MSNLKNNAQKLWSDSCGARLVNQWGLSGPTPVARGVSGAKAPPLAARATLTTYHKLACGCKAEIQVGVFESTVFYLVNGSGYSNDAV